MTAIAVIGLAGRFPDSPTVERYWANLLAGRDCITRASAEELHGLVPEGQLGDPRWVGASGRIEGVFDFDPGFFGMAISDARITDPQHRLLLRTACEALEDACVVPGADDARIGVFAGVGNNRHEALVRAALAARGEEPDELALEIGHAKDHASTKLAYRLGLTGPSMAVQSACSTGLLAIHQACQSLAAYESDVALAAAAAIRVPEQYGYVYLPGSIGSADGSCRPFSSRASGAVAGDGVAAVVLKRLVDAEADGDRILAVVRGSAVNNDGAKAGYGAVSAAAQERVIRDALLLAEVEPATVGSIEAHGSGTALGDAVEWSALSAVYGKSSGPGPWVGSVKSAVGHLREAAGLAGFIRAVLSVRDGVVPPILNLGLPADYVSRDHGALRLPRAVQTWTSRDPRRAAISSFGLGGTNAHLIVEQPPARPEPTAAAPAAEGRAEVLLVSAGSAAGLAGTTAAWREALLTDGAEPAAFADVSQSGRRHRTHRRFAVGSEPASLAEQLATDSEAVSTLAGRRDLAFVFPGVGDQYSAMAAGLHGRLPGFDRRLTDYLRQCGELAGRDLLKDLYPDGVRQRPAATEATFDLRRLAGRSTQDGSALFDPVGSHAVLFSLQLALAQSLADLGLTPAAVTGHSLGELVAASVAGVFRLDDALQLVVRRAQLVAQQPESAMLAVSLPADRALELTGPEVWLAAVNSPRGCVLGGTPAGLLAVQEQLSRREEPGRLLPVRHAFHTPLLRAAGEQLAELLCGYRLSRPAVPMVANLTGQWADEEFTDPGYWSRQLTAPVLFGQALVTTAERCRLLLEIGPGQLRTLAAQSGAALGGATVLATMRREYQREADDAVLGRALGGLWQAGVEIDWPRLRGGAPARRAGLPPTALDLRPLRIADRLPDLTEPRTGAAAIPTATGPSQSSPVRPAPATTTATATAPIGAGSTVEPPLPVCSRCWPSCGPRSWAPPTRGPPTTSSNSAATR